MATIKLFLGKGKEDRVNLLVRIRDGRNVDIRWKTPYKIQPNYWDDKRQTIKNRVYIEPDEKAELLGNIEKIKTLTEQAYKELKESADDLTTDNFSKYIDMLLYPKRHSDNTFFNDWEEFLLSKNSLSYTALGALVQSRNALLRFEKYMQVFVDKRFIASYNSLTDIVLKRFYDFIINEYKYMNHPSMVDFYASADTRELRGVRHINTANTRLVRLKTFWLWSIKKGYTNINPFYTFKIPADRYSAPIFLLSEEVKKIYTLDFSDNKKLEQMRDIFIFQCMIGCRREDLWNLTRANIQNGILEYIPYKTLDSSQKPLRIPLNTIASEILDKYKDDKKLVPINLSIKSYNGYIRKICYTAELNRKVTILNAKGLPEIKELKDVVSSHTARKTFISILINNGVAPQVISSMTGHTANSKAFARYFTIEDDIKTQVVKKLEL